MGEEKLNTPDRIRQLVPINELPDEVKTAFLKKTVMLTLPEGEYLFKRGDKDAYSYYLLEGEIELQGDENKSSLKENTKEARYAMAQLKPRKYDAMAVCDSVVLRIVKKDLDHLIKRYEEEHMDSYGKSMEVFEDDTTADGDEVDWMFKVLQSELFARLPSANIQKLFAIMEPIELNAGDNVITQGEPGDHYYIIQEGECEVLRKPRADAKEIKLANLTVGNGFGEEALFTEAPRNATIKMLTDGVVMQLGRQDFMELIKEPILHPVSYEDAVNLVEIGNGQWLDVRFKNEFENSHIEGSISLPINILRMQADKLPKGKQYIAYCDTGGRSLTATFLLTSMGYEVCYLGGGLNNCAKSMEIVLSEQSATIKATLDSKPKSSPVKKSKKKTADKTKMADINTEKEAVRLRKREEAIIAKMQKEAEKLLQDEEEKIKELCSTSSEKLNELKARKQQTMKKIQKKNEEIKKVYEEAKIKNEEYRILCKELEDSYSLTTDPETEQLEELNRRVCELEKEKMEVERKILVERISAYQEEIKKAKMEIEAAEMEHEKIKADTELVIAQSKKNYQQNKSIVKNSLTSHEEELEKDQEKVKQTLEGVKKSILSAIKETEKFQEENTQLPN